MILMAEELFHPTRTYLLKRYRKEQFQVDSCNAYDKVCVEPVYRNLILKHAVYAKFRDDLAAPETWDEVYERAFADVYGLPYPWPVRTGGLADKFGAGLWAKKRIRLHLYVNQLLTLPYTWKNLKEFCSKVERELHYYPYNFTWIDLQFKSKEQNILTISLAKNRQDASQYQQTLFLDTAGVIFTLCRRICPCSIYCRLEK
ncbi:MAG: hypothetical protein MJ014_00065 [Methanocorpusculum sp.]|nr:hypothetical protein [Methanocorpusculum sp.]